ncbi:MAG: molybdenum cofactor guanylyltransferase MobA [Pseudomonadota bacterium]|nr:molybdenum cofactor guanylyltransferase MobA [Pseudomonadota bacterium]
MSRSPSGGSSSGPGSSVSGLILAGGRGRRMGSTDKGWVSLKDRPLIQWVCDRLSPQVADLVINANQNRARYEALGFSVVEDTLPGYQGPLAGLATGLAALETELVLAVPVDAPVFPADLGQRLLEALVGAQADVAVVHDGERIQPTFLLLRRVPCLLRLQSALAAGEHGLGRWVMAQSAAFADFAGRSREFSNVNYPEDLVALASCSGGALDNDSTEVESHVPWFL